MFSISITLLTIVEKVGIVPYIHKINPKHIFRPLFEEHQTLIEIVIEVFL